MVSIPQVCNPNHSLSFKPLTIPPQACLWIQRRSLAYDHSPWTLRLHLLTSLPPRPCLHFISRLYDHLAIPCTPCHKTCLLALLFSPPWVILAEKEICNTFATTTISSILGASASPAEDQRLGHVRPLSILRGINVFDLLFCASSRSSSVLVHSRVA